MKLIVYKYRRARGGHSRILRINCANCGNFIALYQKDGVGILKRMYFDRILSPKELSGLNKTAFGKVPNLVCEKCKQTLGVPFIYKKEKRGSFRLFEGVVGKKVTRAPK